jgi:hypothetical protein
MLTIKEDALLKAFNKKIPFSEVNQLSSLLLAGDTEPVAETMPSESIN